MSRMSEYFSYGMMASLLILPTIVDVKDISIVALKKLYLYPLYFRFEYSDSIEVFYGWTLIVFIPSLFLGAFVYAIRQRNFESRDTLVIFVLILQQLVLYIFYINTVISPSSWIFVPLPIIGFTILLILRVFAGKLRHEPLQS